jgi:hypothetical protein
MFIPNNWLPKLHPVKPAAKSMARPTKAVARPTKAVDHLQKLDGVAPMLCCLLGLLLIARLMSGSNVSSVAQVGDKLEFAVGSVSITAPTTAVPARFVAGPWSSPGRSCVLDVSTMMQPGGTLTVTSMRPDGVMLSWFGGATAAGAKNCQGAGGNPGANAGYLVSDAEYERLAMAEKPVGWTERH